MDKSVKDIYLDHAATTYVRPEIKAVMGRYFSEEFGNPGSFHSPGLRAREALDNARTNTAKILNCKPEEIIFTGSGTESINLAIKGLARANKDKGRHIITSKVEHEAVLETCRYLEKYEGFEITCLNVDKFGRVNPEDLEKAVRKDTVLITIMYANNEVGTIQPIKRLAQIAKKHNIPFHTDACQAAGALNINAEELGVDLMTLNSSKIYGPKGVGLLYKKENIKIHPIIHGGGQESGLRSGTQNIPGIVGFAKALELAQAEKEKENARLIRLRDKLISGLQKSIPKTLLNGHPAERLPNNASITFLDVEGEAMMLHLNEHNIYTSSGSACTSYSLEPSHVIIALGHPYEIAHGTLRFTLGKQTTEKDINKVIEVLPGIVESLRKISPVKLDEAELK